MCGAAAENGGDRDGLALRALFPWWQERMDRRCHRAQLDTLSGVRPDAGESTSDTQHEGERSPPRVAEPSLAALLVVFGVALIVGVIVVALARSSEKPKAAEPDLVSRRCHPAGDLQIRCDHDF